MNYPGFLIKEVEPGIEGEIGLSAGGGSAQGGNVAEMSREFEATGLEFGAEKVNHGITPHGFEGGMIKINVADPAFEIRGQTAGGSGKMDMEIAFEIAAESMDGGIDAWDERPFVLIGKVADDLGWDRSKFIKKVAVEPEERLQMIGQSESDVLPNGVWERIKSGLDPIVSVLFTARGTEAGFTGMGRLNHMEAFWTDKDMPAKQRGTAGKHFKHIGNNGGTHQLMVGEEEFPPITIINEDVPDFDLTADEFHRGNIVKFKRW